MNQIFTAMFTSARWKARDGGGLVLYNYLPASPSPTWRGTALLVRRPDAQLTFPNFMRAQLYSRPGHAEDRPGHPGPGAGAVDRLLGHGGLFKTPVVGQKILAAAAWGAPGVRDGDRRRGGPWGMALLAPTWFRRKRESPGGLSGATGLCRTAITTQTRRRGRSTPFLGRLPAGPGGGTPRARRLQRLWRKMEVIP